MGLSQSYFSLSGLNPLPALERRLHPYRHRRSVLLRGGGLDVRWTERAERELARRGSPLPVTLQLYFSCVIKKRVLFPAAAESGAVAMDTHFQISMHTVSSDHCDPVEFARHYPVRDELDSTQARKMRARSLYIDFRKHQWQGEFHI